MRKRRQHLWTAPKLKMWLVEIYEMSIKLNSFFWSKRSCRSKWKERVLSRKHLNLKAFFKFHHTYQPVHDLLRRKNRFKQNNAYRIAISVHIRKKNSWSSISSCTLFPFTLVYSSPRHFQQSSEICFLYHIFTVRYSDTRHDISIWNFRWWGSVKINEQDFWHRKAMVTAI